jgi:hypothetical protein
MRADLVQHRRATRGEEALDGVEIALARTLVHAEAERLRDRRADARKHHQRTGDRGPHGARVRLAACLRIDEGGVAVPLGGFEAARERKIRERNRHRVWMHVTPRGR